MFACSVEECRTLRAETPREMKRRALTPAIVTCVDLRTIRDCGVLGSRQCAPSWDSGGSGGRGGRVPQRSSAGSARHSQQRTSQRGDDAAGRRAQWRNLLFATLRDHSFA